MSFSVAGIDKIPFRCNHALKRSLLLSQSIHVKAVHNFVTNRKRIVEFRGMLATMYVYMLKIRINRKRQEHKSCKTKLLVITNLYRVSSEYCQSFENTTITQSLAGGSRSRKNKRNWCDTPKACLLSIVL